MPAEILRDEAAVLDRLIADAVDGEQREFLRRNPGMMLHLVRWEGGIKIEVFSDEHPPPHFRLRHKNRSANFKIADCEQLNGDLRLPHRAVLRWWNLYRLQIAQAWNAHRPSDCPVGLIDIATLGW